MARRAQGPDAPRRPPLAKSGGTPEPPGRADAVPECTACGTCCFSTLPEYVRVFGCDWDRMDDRARALTHFLGNRCYMRIEDGRCAALVLDVVERGDDTPGPSVELGDTPRPPVELGDTPRSPGPPAPRFLCSIYEMRPDACRALERGSGACRGELHEKGERPLLAVERLLRGR